MNRGAPEVSFPAMQGTRPPTSGSDPSQPSVALVMAAFASIYVIWGSTYLAIRFAIESIPPLFMAGVRKFPNDISLEVRSVHDIEIIHIAVKEAEAVMMLGRNNDIPDPDLLE